MAPPDRHVVVDGSNIATEGRSLPSLDQLDEAVQAFIADHPKHQVTVVVDATFAHRIKPKERKAFEAAVDAGEIVVPPAGAVGRGDAFILQVADKANSLVLSNDSFQEFHGEHSWLFETGRLIGAKPVEGVGWIFVDRLPVRGQESRRATRATGRASKDASPKRSTAKKQSRGNKSATKRTAAKKDETKATRNKSSKDDNRKASKPKKSSTSARKKGSANNRGDTKKNDGGKKAGGASDKAANTPAQFLGFVTRVSIGDTVVGLVDEFSSHGCYLQIASARVYLPSKAMGDPPPSRARDVVSVGQKVRVRVESLDADRRGINVELVEVLEMSGKRSEQNRPSSRREKGQQNKTSQKPTSVADGSAREANLTRSKTNVAKSTKKAAKKPSVRRTKKKAASGVKKTAKATQSTRAKKAATKKAAPKKAAAKKTAPKKAAAKKTAAKRGKKATKKAAPKKAAARSSAKKTAAKKTGARASKKATKRAAPKKAAAKKTAAKRGKK